MLMAALFIDIKEAFDHIIKMRLVEKMMKLGINGDLIWLT